jgi:hypothetical protein
VAAAHEAAGLRRELAAAEPDYFTDGSLDQSRSSEWASHSSHSLDDHTGAALIADPLNVGNGDDPELDGGDRRRLEDLLDPRPPRKYPRGV